MPHNHLLYISQKTVHYYFLAMAAPAVGERECVSQTSLSQRRHAEVFGLLTLRFSAPNNWDAVSINNFLRESVNTIVTNCHTQKLSDYLNYYKRGMKGLPTATPSSPSKMIIIIVNEIIYFLEVPISWVCYILLFILFMKSS